MKHITLILFLTLLSISCADFTQHRAKTVEVNEIKIDETDDGSGQIFTFLTFQKNDAEEAMNFYISLFDNSKVVELIRRDKEEQGTVGTIMHATFILNGNHFMCSDSPPVHEWDFTPAVSNFVECKSDGEIKNLYTKLSDNGKVLMPLNNYGFSKMFGFVEDRFGVCWQLNLK